MKDRILSMVVLTFLAMGCDSSRLDSEVSKLKQSNAELLDQLKAANKRLEETESQMASLRTEMREFKEAFDSEKRQQLTENVKAVEGLLMDLRRDTASANTTLEEIQGLKTEVKKLRDLCVKHESEAKDANEIGKIKKSVTSLQQSVEKLERSLGTGANPNIGGRVRQLESELRRLESKVRRLPG
ncbi:MAG: hypothetical protein KDA84_06855 [Planctomycetaceae bacterium]|nr:hypothetical protein [Planctomycetaceae bacterium]